MFWGQIITLDVLDVLKKINMVQGHEDSPLNKTYKKYELLYNMNLCILTMCNHNHQLKH